MANLTINDALPWIIGGAGLLVAYHFLMGRQEDPALAAATNTPNYPDFPRVGIDPPHDAQPMADPQLQWPHPYAHPVIPRYIGAPAYFQNSIPLSKEHYVDDVWYDKQAPPLHVTVSQNLPTPETYSHHHFWFDQEAEPAARPIDLGNLKNIV